MFSCSGLVCLLCYVLPFSSCMFLTICSVIQASRAEYTERAYDRGCQTGYGVFGLS